MRSQNNIPRVKSHSLYVPIMKDADLKRRKTAMIFISVKYMQKAHHFHLQFLHYDFIIRTENEREERAHVSKVPLLKLHLLF